MSLTSKYVKQTDKKSKTSIKITEANLAGNLPTIRRKYTQTKDVLEKKVKRLNGHNRRDLFAQF